MKNERDSLDNMLREVETLRNRKHENIVPLLASFTMTSIDSEYEVMSLNLIFPYAETDMDVWMEC